MDPLTQQGCTPHSLEWEDMLQALRREMEAGFRRADLEMGRLRQRVRELEGQVAELRAAAGLAVSNSG